MKKIVLMSIVVSLLTAGAAIAHHGYGEYDRNTTVALEGTVQSVVWANPHVILILETENKGQYSVEWGSVSQLARQGIRVVPLRAGDHVVISGCLNKNPEKKILTLLREINRPADGWRWVNSWNSPQSVSSAAK